VVPAITSDAFVKFLVGQMLDQLRKHGAAGVHPTFLSLPSLLRLPIQTALKLVRCSRRYLISRARPAHRKLPHATGVGATLAMARLHVGTIPRGALSQP